ncbi:MAG: zinc ribbon domain-containing protein [Candidatus Hodarchaeales archaeon]
MLEKELAGDHLAEAWGVDPGMKRLVYAVNDSGTRKVVVTGDDLEIRPLLHDLRMLNNRIAKLQRKGKIRALKRLRSKRGRKAEQIRGIVARKTATSLPATPVLVGVGYPANLRSTKGIRPVNKPSGRNGNKNKPERRISRKHRKRLNRWAYDNQGKKIVSHCLERGHLAHQLNEWKSTRTCNKCGSENTLIKDRYFECHTCGYIGDRDGNGGHNISYYTQWKLYLAMNDCSDDSLLSNVSPGFVLPPSRVVRLVRGTGGVPAVNSSG